MRTSLLVRAPASPALTTVATQPVLAVKSLSSSSDTSNESCVATVTVVDVVHLYAVGLAPDPVAGPDVVLVLPPPETEQAPRASAVSNPKTGTRRPARARLVPRQPCVVVMRRPPQLCEGLPTGMAHRTGR